MDGVQTGFDGFCLADSTCNSAQRPLECSLLWSVHRSVDGDDSRPMPARIAFRDLPDDPAFATDAARARHPVQAGHTRRGPHGA